MPVHLLHDLEVFAIDAFRLCLWLVILAVVFLVIAAIIVIYS